ncbi:hypothetical protein TNCT_429771 [Trichonephila clavata]|uniref:Uncharacterized protein n=1 Tax=Trichonephila clavata TaxID=2740835 RepID=A0A8X6M0X9_TRICU|nr:hypothetical protein TNCT_429771 [Trichonephila clavata]
MISIMLILLDYFEKRKCVHEKEPWNMRYREEERPQIIVEPNMAVMPQFLGQALVMNGSTESTSTEQFTTITTLFYG